MIWITATCYRSSKERCVLTIENFGHVISRKTRKQHPLHGFMTWMNVEMKSRMRASALLKIRNKYSVNHLKQFQEGEDQFSNHRCCLCKTSSHWVNQCRKFSSLNRVQHLQRAKRESTTPVIAVERELVDTTGRRKQCTEKENGVQCAHFHHPSSTETVAKEQLLLQLRQTKKTDFQSFQ